jgi:hypothetical protein
VVNGQLLDTAVTVNGGGTLGGDGKVPATTVQAGGVLAPGDSPGTLTVGSLSLATGSTFNEQLGGTIAGTRYDQTVIPAGCTVSLDSSTLNISFLGSFLPAVGQKFTIIKNQGGSSVSGTFIQGSTYTVNGYTFGINYRGGSGHDVVLTVLSRTVGSQVPLSKSVPVDDRATQLSSGTVTIAGAGTTNLMGAPAIEVPGLTAGVTRANAGGSSPYANPYVSINLANGVPSPGQSSTFKVLFKNRRASTAYHIFPLDEVADW